jgi:ribosomal protein S27E
VPNRTNVRNIGSYYTRYRRLNETGRMQGESMVLERVWDILRNDLWENDRQLMKASGLDDATLGRVINFLDRWGFVETRRTPNLLVRRKPGVISPVETINLLRSIKNNMVASTRDRVAERVACRVCGCRDLSIVGINEVECTRCHEKQWRTIERMQASIVLEENDPRKSPCLFKRFLVRVGLPQTAYVRHIPRPTRFYWFRCSACKRTSTDYSHGHMKYLTCQYCKTMNTFPKSPLYIH